MRVYLVNSIGGEGEDVAVSSSVYKALISGGKPKEVFKGLSIMRFKRITENWKVCLIRNSGIYIDISYCLSAPVEEKKGLAGLLTK
jgi:hypothetical protein